MKKNFPVTGVENDYPATSHIVSTTDLKGLITSANRDFVKISGFDCEDLLYKSHNIVRHPDMPPAAFADLWQTIKQGKPWMGMVKNRCKNGDHYWVNAFVTPIFENEKVAGYQSVRTKPTRKQIERAEQLYGHLNHGMSLWQKIRNCCRPGLMVKVFLGYVFALLPALFIAALMDASKTATLSSIAAVALPGGWLAAKLIARPWQQAARESRHIFDNPLAQQVYAGRGDELGQLQLVIEAQKGKLSTAIWRIREAAENLDSIASQTAEVAGQTNMSIQRQLAEIESVATAMNEMSHTVQDVAQNAADTAAATEQADHDVLQGKSVVTDTISGINQLAVEVENVSEAISKLAADSEQIGSVVHVIRGIADQTNLLALNAAIEAARAGEQGRGFAVVADEVRTLASRTQASTDEIQQMIQQLQQGAGKAVQAMDQGQAITRKSVEQANLANASLEEITQAVSRISDMSAQIATASEQQSSVTEEINRNINNINGVAEMTATASQETTDLTAELVAEAAALRTLVQQFGADH